MGTRAATAIGSGTTSNDDGTTNVPTWALWLIGAVGSLALAVFAGMAYIISVQRSQPKVVVRLDKTQSTDAAPQGAAAPSTDTSRGRAASMQVIDVDAKSEATTGTVTTNRADGGVICLD